MGVVDTADQKLRVRGEEGESGEEVIKLHLRGYLSTLR